jgi:hypothetical protein
VDLLSSAAKNGIEVFLKINFLHKLFENNPVQDKGNDYSANKNKRKPPSLGRFGQVGHYEPGKDNKKDDKADHSD